MLADRLEKHAAGEIEMTNSQVRAAEILLRKCVPDLSAVTLDGEVRLNPVADLLKAIDGKSRGIPEGR